MYYQQTLISNIELNKTDVVPDETGEKEVFAQTAHDLKVSDFIDSLESNGFMPLTVASTAAGEHLVTFVQYQSIEEIKKMERMQKFNLNTPAKFPA